MVAGGGSLILGDGGPGGPTHDLRPPGVENSVAQVLWTYDRETLAHRGGFVGAGLVGALVGRLVGRRLARTELEARNNRRTGTNTFPSSEFEELVRPRPNSVRVCRYSSSAGCP